MSKIIILLQPGVTPDQARQVTDMIMTPGNAVIAFHSETVASIQVVDGFDNGEVGVNTIVTPEKFEAALRHSINYHSIDAKANIPDYELAELLMPEIGKHLEGKTDVQVFERMTPEERANIGKENEE